jgi:hypothetical protein
MAKENPSTKAKEQTAFQKFEQLARKLIAVPKERIQSVRSKKQLS